MIITKEKHNTNLASRILYLDIYSTTVRILNRSTTPRTLKKEIEPAYIATRECVKNDRYDITIMDENKHVKYVSDNTINITYQYAMSVSKMHEALSHFISLEDYLNAVIKGVEDEELDLALCMDLYQLETLLTKTKEHVNSIIDNGISELRQLVNL